MDIQYEVFTSINADGYQKWYDSDGNLIRCDDEHFKYDSGGKLISKTWREFIGNEEVYETFFRINFEYSQKKESWYKYKIGSVSFGESSQASYENREPKIQGENELVHIREEIYDENKRIILIKQFDLENSFIEQTSFEYTDGVFTNYKTITDGNQTEEKVHHYNGEYFFKMTHSFSFEALDASTKNIEIFYDINGFETSRKYQFKLYSHVYQTNIEFVYEENRTTAILSNVIFGFFLCNEILSLPHDSYYPNLDFYADTTINFKMIFNYETDRIVSVYLYNNDDNSLLEFFNFFESFIHNPLTQKLSHKIISGFRYFENKMEKQFTHMLHY
jgi:hypothetical protein